MDGRRQLRLLFAETETHLPKRRATCHALREITYKTEPTRTFSSKVGSIKTDEKLTVGMNRTHLNVILKNLDTLTNSYTKT